MSECPNGEYFSVTLQQCMDKRSFANYLNSLLTGRQVDLLQQEQAALSQSEQDALREEIGSESLLGPDPLGLQRIFKQMTNSLVTILVVIVGVLLVALAVNAWLNEQGTGVKVPVKLK